MSIISRMRKQDAIYWARVGYDVNGQPTYDSPVGIECRWEDTAEEFIDAQGTRCVSRAVVYVDREVTIGGVLMLGDVDSSGLEEEYPLENEGAVEIKQFSKMPNLKATEYLLTAHL